jgi:Na+-driven multidrug efflux pump
MSHPTGRLGEEGGGRLLFVFSLPAIAGMAVASLHTVIDRVFLGNAVGPDAIGALSICMPIVFVIIGFSMLVVLGASSETLPMATQYMRQGIAGAAVATVIAQALAAGWTLAHFRSRRSVLRLRLAHVRLHAHVLRPVLAIGLAPCCMQLSASLVSVLTTVPCLATAGTAPSTPTV